MEESLLLLWQSSQSESGWPVLRGVPLLELSQMSSEEYYHWSSIDDGWICPRCEREALPFFDTSHLTFTCSSSLSESSEFQIRSALLFQDLGPVLFQKTFLSHTLTLGVSCQNWTSCVLHV